MVKNLQGAFSLYVSQDSIRTAEIKSKGHSEESNCEHLCSHFNHKGEFWAVKQLCVTRLRIYVSPIGEEHSKVKRCKKHGELEDESWQGNREERGASIFCSFRFFIILRNHCLSN